MSGIQIINSDVVFIYLMEIEENRFSEYLNKLTDYESVRLNSIAHPKKKLEFAASRYLKQSILGERELNYDETGAPHLSNGPYISLSHTHTHVCLATSENFPVGVDIETIRDTSVKVVRRFVAPNEFELFDAKSAAEMTLLWSLKETMYKLSDRNELLFQQHLLVKDRNQNTYCVHVLNRNGFKQYTLKSFQFDTFFITCNITQGTYL